MKKQLLIIISCFFLLPAKSLPQSWSPVGSGTSGLPCPMCGGVYALAEYNNMLYAGGDFIIAGGLTVNGIAKWDGTSWSSLDSGVGGSDVKALTVYNNELYVAGAFNTAGGITVHNIARWNGTTWDSVGSGTNGYINSMAVYNGELYVGGDFYFAGGSVANHIAKWNGTNWSAVGTFGIVHTMAVYNGELYVGGVFTFGGVSANNISRWNGTTWSTVGTGTTGPGVFSLAVYNNELYAGGLFSTAGGIAANDIAKWNDTTWSSVGSGLTGIPHFVRALAVFNNNLYAGGDFQSAGATVVNRVAQWDGTNWSALGYGVNNKVFSLAGFNSELYVGGMFSLADSIPADNIAKWNPNVAPVPAFTSSGVSVCGSGCLNFTNLTQHGNTYLWIFPGATPSLSTNTNPQNICYGLTGMYDVTLIATNNFSTDTVTFPNFIAVHSLPVAFSLVQQGDTLFAPPDFAGYQWYFNNTLLINDTSYFYVVTQNGNFNVHVTDSNNCEIGAGVFITNVGTNDHENLDNDIRVFPNPALDEVNFYFPGSKGPCRLTVFNTLGEEVFAKILEGDEVKQFFSTQNISPGFYSVVYRCRETVFTKKLVVK